MKNKALTIELIMVCALLAGLATGAWLWGRTSNKEGVSASAVRVEAQKAWEVYSHPSAKAYHYDPKSFASYRTERASGTLKIVMAHGAAGASFDDAEPNNYSVVHAAPGDEIRLGTDSMRLDLISAEGLTSETLQASSGGASPAASDYWRNKRLYRADGKLLKPGESKPDISSLWMREPDLAAQYGFYLKHDGQSPFKLIGFAAFDARTHWKANAESWTAISNGTDDAAVAQLFIEHRAPVDLAFDLAWGKPEIVVQPPREGAEFVFSNGAMKLLAIDGNGGIGSGWRYESSSTGGDAVTLNMGLGAGDLTHAVFSSDLQEKGAWTISAIDEKGAIIPSRALGGSGRFKWFEFKIPVEKIAKIRVENLPNTTRAIVSLPELYGTPEINRDVEDLMKVRIPFLRIASGEQLQTAVEGYLQLRIVGYRGGRPAIISYPISGGAGFPLDFSNVRTGDLLKIYEAGLQPHRLRIDEAKGEIQIIFNEPTWIETILSRFHIRF